jgi:hypothetical protein
VNSYTAATSSVPPASQRPEPLHEISPANRLRAAAETPSEHQRRITGADPRWAAASPIVAAFEDLRYGERMPDVDTVVRARDALRAVEAAVRT